jgi:DNA-binding IclR family transcriptional regulator
MNKAPAAIQVIDRSAKLMEAIAAYEGPVSLKILSAETGLHPSTAYRILGSLTDVGFVDRDSAGQYMIGHKIRNMAERSRHGVDIRQIAGPEMKQLRDEIGETVNLTVREGDEVIYIERATPSRMMRVEQVVGSRAPLHVTAVGKLMLGELGDDFIEAYSKRTGLKSYTEHTLSNPGDLVEAVHKVKEQGVSYDNEEAEIGVGCIGVLIRNKQGDVVAGLSVSAPIERRKDEWSKLLKAAAIRIAEKL